MRPIEGILGDEDSAWVAMEAGQHRVEVADPTKQIPW